MFRRKVFPGFGFLVVMILFSLTLLSACGDNTLTPVLPTAFAFQNSPSVSNGSPGATTPKGSQTPPPVTITGQIKIGGIETLSGNNSAYGIAIKNGFDLAVEEVNNSKLLGTATLNLISVDDKGDKQTGISAMTQLIDQEKVVAVLGPTLSSTANAADPIAQQKGIPVLGTSDTANGITEMGNFIFRASLPEGLLIPAALAQVKAKLNPKKVVLIYEASDEFTKTAALYKIELQKNGISLAGSETYPPGENDFRTQLNKLKAFQPDLLIVSGLIGEGATLVQQAREVGISGPILGGNGFNTLAFITQAKDAAEGVILGSAWFAGSDNPKSQAFVAAYKRKFNVEPDQYAAQAYNGVYLLATAMRDANSTDPKAVRDALSQLKNFDSIFGTFSFDANRNPVQDPVVVTVKGSKFVLYQ